MKAVRLHAQGGPENLVYEEVEKPIPLAGEALVEVFACGVSPKELTWSSTEKLPCVIGHEISGTVAAIASGVTNVKVGDTIYALTDFFKDGGGAEYIAMNAADLAPKPASLDFVQAASVPLSALTAWQALFDHGKLQKGARLLIHGASGGVGIFALQLAKWCGSEVIATASERNIAFLRGLGADEVIDYTKERFEEKVEKVDLVLDLVGGETLDRSWKVLQPTGLLVTIVKPISAHADHKGLFFIVKPNRQQLMEIGQLIDSGKIQPFVEAIYPLAEAKKAYVQGLKGPVRGKTVLKVK